MNQPTGAAGNLGPHRIRVTAPAVTLEALCWEPSDHPASAPIALCLHGFPDTPYSWSTFAPELTAAGWRVIAPFMRGYAPSTVPSDGSYHIGALMDDALRVLGAAGMTGRDVVIGHDWGAVAANGLSATPDSPFTKAVVMSVPPIPAFRPLRGVGARRSLPALMPAQFVRSWYGQYIQLPWLPERSASWLPSLLWRRWSPNHDASNDLRHVAEAIGSDENWRAALGPYRATLRPGAPPEQYASLHAHWDASPMLPTLYLHGIEDGCISVKFADRVRAVLPAGSAVQLVDKTGHFIQVERPSVAARHVLDFIGPA